jgi:mannose-6-phosphate isomerase-like protein (cupin superfamily)
MRYLVLLAFLFCSYFSFGQILTQDVKTLEPKKDYTNVETILLHSDENSSVFIIYIKQAARKHVHQYHTEVVTVLDGTGRMYLGGDYFDIKKGDHIVIPPNTAHAVITTSGKPLKVLSVQSPEFLGQDRIFIEEEEIPESGTGSNDGKKDKKDKEEEDDIPEFEGEDD